jgi:Kef-type K+ transport system membrane component KefB
MGKGFALYTGSNIENFINVLVFSVICTKSNPPETKSLETIMKDRKIEIKWGVLFVLVGLIWMVFEKTMGWHDVHIDKHATYTNFIAPIAIAIYVLALLDKKRNFYQGKMTYKQGFISGLVVTLVVVILSPFSQYITSTYITPDYFQNAIAYSVSSIQMDQQAAEEYFNLKNYIFQSVIGAAIMGILTSALVAIFVRSKP